MFLIELTGSVGCLWLYPYSELYSVLLGIIDEVFKSVRKLAGVDNPVAEGCIIGITLVFAAKPSVIHDKQFAAHIGNVSHHLVHVFLIDVEVNALPRVQKDAAKLIAMSQAIHSSPLMEVAGSARKTFL